MTESGPEGLLKMKKLNDLHNARVNLNSWKKAEKPLADDIKAFMVAHKIEVLADAATGVSGVLGSRRDPAVYRLDLLGPELMQRLLRTPGLFNVNVGLLNEIIKASGGAPSGDIARLISAKEPETTSPVLSIECECHRK